MKQQLKSEPGEYDFVALKRVGENAAGRFVAAGTIRDGKVVDFEVLEADVSLPVAWEQVRVAAVKRLRR